MKTSQFTFDLPEELIAQKPLDVRSSSRLLVVDRNATNYQDSVFSNLTSFLSEGDLLVFNDTRVINARLRGQKDTGGLVELMIDQIFDSQTARCLIKASRRPKIGQLITVAQDISFRVTSFADGVFEVECSSDIHDCLAKHGEIPLPPYIQRATSNEDVQRYQTTYAKNPGAVAAPTAGLHFEANIFDQLRLRRINTAYLTLHVGLGTFKPVSVDDISDHEMHYERFCFPEKTAEMISKTKQKGGRIIAVGTTSLRVLEAVYANDTIRVGEGKTNLFITPGYKFNIVDCLVTNFHLPRSTLFMLVSAFVGTDRIKSAYKHAISEKYRFFSYGDAMLLIR